MRRESGVLLERYAAEKGEARRCEAIVEGGARRSAESAGISVRRRMAAAPVKLMCICFDVSVKLYLI